MSKKDLIAPFLIAGLSIAFAFICLMVFLNNGKSAKWVSRKMLVGGLLLSLMTFPEMGCRRASCYFMPKPPLLYRITENREKVKLSIAKSNYIKGKVNFGKSSNLMYNIKLIGSKDIIQKGKLTPIDGQFDSKNEKFVVNLEKALNPGKYILIPNGYHVTEIKIP